MIIDNHPFKTNPKGHLEIGGIDSIDLAKKYGTPLYVYDVSMIRENSRSFVNTFENLGVKAQVSYASKAFSSVAMLQVAKQEGLSLDVVSEGELYTALQANYPTEKIHMHGNNKSVNELTMAIENDIGCIVLDNFYEIELLEGLLKRYNKQMDVLMRVTPGIESDTHHYIMTGHEDSKFGFNLSNGQADEAFKLIYDHQYINFKGLHSHIGSQIFDTKQFVMANEILFHKLSEWHADYQYLSEVLNLGGGFGIRYTKDDQPLPHETHVQEIIEAVQEQVKEKELPMPEIWIEPGRSIVGNAGITLYEVGSMKHIPGIRDYISIDGGMADNIRPALYGARYEAVIANKVKEEPIKKASIAGKCCESGDMLIWDLPIPKVESGDILAVFSTGAYAYSMASHYNRLAKPAVVFVENGIDKLVVRRETYQDVVRSDLSYE